MKKLLFCFGTRPEAIKMAPVIKEAKDKGHVVSVCITGQHRDMIIPFMEFFEIEENYNLDIMKHNQTLGSMTANILLKVEDVMDEFQPDVVLVQGDTTTTFTCALAAFYKKIPIAHIEAGLRTGDIMSPFPEEANRTLVSPLATFHFPPTDKSMENLKKEGIVKNVVVTGNTSIDSLKITIDKINSTEINAQLEEKYKDVSFNKNVILVTTHRRENHGEPLERICKAIKEIAETEDVEIVLPVHLNPNVKSVVESHLSSLSNVHLLKPLEYVDFTWLMSKSHLLLTDSGGVQEEGPYFKKPILVMRENTERPEGIEAEVSKLVGSDKELIISEVKKLLHDRDYYASYSRNVNPYGDGSASEKIVDLITK